MFKRFTGPLLTVLLALGAGLPAVAKEDAMTVLVTGANRGIGLEMARQLREQGHTVIGTARKPGEAAELKALGARVEQLDVADSASVRALAERLEGQSIDILVNNAGMIGHEADGLANYDIDQLRLTFDVNSLGPLRVTQALLDNLRAGETRKVIQVSSIMGSIQNNGGGYYGYRSSKAALNMLNKSLALELAEDGFTCIAIHPGWVKTRIGGPGAQISPSESVAGMLAVIAGLDADDTGRFVDYQGKDIPW